MSGFAATTWTRASVPQINTTITHLRDVLGDPTYESLARKGETMTTAEMVAYAYDQIDQARTELNAVSKWTTYESLNSQSQLRATYNARHAPRRPSALVQRETT
jgi:hypothetical protein